MYTVHVADGAVFFPQVEEKADSIARAVKAHVEYANDVSSNMLTYI